MLPAKGKKEGKNKKTKYTFIRDEIDAMEEADLTCT